MEYNNLNFEHAYKVIRLVLALLAFLPLLERGKFKNLVFSVIHHHFQGWEGGAPNLFAILQGKSTWKSDISMTKIILTITIGVVCITNIIIKIKFRNCRSGGKFSNPIKHIVVIACAVSLVASVLQALLVITKMAVLGMVFPQLLLGFPTGFMLAVFYLRHPRAVTFHRTKLAAWREARSIGGRNTVRSVTIRPESHGAGDTHGVVTTTFARGNSETMPEIPGFVTDMG